MYSIPLEIFPIEDDGFHICIEAKINGRPARLLVDTGASRTVFDQERIKTYIDENEAEMEEMDKLSTGLGTNSMKSHTFNLQSLQLGSLEIEAFEAVAIDMNHINESYQKIGIAPIDGVIGGDILMAYGASLDYGDKSLELNIER